MRGAFRVVAGLLLSATLASAGSADPPQPPADPPQAAPAISVGIEERFRLEDWDNLADHNASADDHRTQWRFRTRAWATVRFGAHAAFGIGLNNESKGQDNPALPLALDEIVLESLWLDIAPSARFDARVGRQNVQKGDGFILTEGTPGDGSRTIYVNGAVATWHIAPQAALDVIFLSQPARDRYLPVVNDAHKLLVEWDEQLAGVYYTDQRVRGLDVQAYFLRKWERHDTRSATHPQFQADRSLDILGARVARATSSHWTFTGEFAGECGTQVPDRPVRAWGGYANVRHGWQRRWSPTLLAGVTALSGDSPSTNTIEQWDPVLSRWPKWSELYIYSLGPEVGASYWTNMALWQIEATIAPTRTTALRGTFYHLTAFNPLTGSAAIFGSGLRRGELFEGRFDFTAGPRLKGHLLYERFLPGSFYAHGSPAGFFRLEMTVALQKAWRSRDYLR